jgi:hypothetical protein
MQLLIDSDEMLRIGVANQVSLALNIVKAKLNAVEPDSCSNNAP